MTLQTLRDKFPSARIYVSALLPRDDELNDMATQTNTFVEEHCDVTKGVTFIQHRNISYDDLYDKLHLDTRGFYKFLWNFRVSMFGMMPRTGKR